MAKYATVLALFAVLAVALAQTTVNREAYEAAPRDLQTANAFGLGYYGGYGLHHGFYGRGFYGGLGFYG